MSKRVHNTKGRVGYRESHKNRRRVTSMNGKDTHTLKLRATRFPLTSGHLTRKMRTRIRQIEKVLVRPGINWHDRSYK